MTTEPYVIEVSDNVDRGIAKELAAIGKQAVTTYTEIERLQSAINSVGPANLGTVTSTLNDLSRKVDSLSQSQARLNQTADRFESSLGKIEKGSQRASNNLNKVERSAQGGNAALQGLVATARRLGALLGITFGLRAIFNAVEAYQEMDSTLRELTKTERDFNAIRQRTIQLSTSSGMSVNTLAEQYGKLAVGYENVADGGKLATDTISALVYALQASDKSLKIQESSLSLLVKGLAAGRVQTREFLSTLQRFPALANLLREAFGVNWAANLKSGLISSADLAKVLSNNLGLLEQKAKSAPASLGSAWAQLEQNFARYVSSTDSATGATALLAKGVALVARNIDLAANAVIFFIGAWALGSVMSRILGLNSVLLGLVSIIGYATQGIALLARGLVAIAAANPFVLLIAGAVALGFALTAIVTGTGNLTERLKDAAGRAGVFAKELIDAAAKGAGLKDTATAATDTAKQLMSGADGASVLRDEVTKAGSDGSSAITTLTNNTEGLENQLNSAAKAADKLTASLKRAAAAQRELNSAGGSVGGAAYGRSFNVGSGNIPRYANGGSFVVDGASGVDRNLVQFMASRGEEVEVKTRAQRRRDEGGSVVYDNRTMQVIFTGVQDADSFRRSQGQIASDLAATVRGGF